MSERQLSFRADLLETIMPLLRAGECCSLVGTSGTGKSNLVRFLRQRDVQAHYFGDDRTWVVVIDTNGLTLGQLPEEVALFELMLHRLVREAAARRMPQEVLSECQRLHSELVQRPNGLLALRYLDHVCGWLIEGYGIRLTFIFDQFEDIWKALSPRLFLNLRYLRDEYKYQLVYLTLTRDRLQLIERRAQDDAPPAEAFWELFATHTFGLGVYSPHDADDMIDQIASRRGVAVAPEVRRAAIEASGRHPALLRAIFWAIQHGAPTGAPTELLRSGAVAEECAKIWGDLRREEQVAVRHIAGGGAPGQVDAATLEEIRLKQIVVGEPARLFAPVFGAYALRQSGATGVEVDPLLRQVWVDGLKIEARLSPLEFRLLAYLARNAGAVCTREDLLRELYQEEAPDKNDERLDGVLRRLREALGDAGRSSRYLITERGVGYKLAQGRLRE